MKKLRWITCLLVAAVWAPAAHARGLSVEVWTDQGNDAVYQPGDAIQLKVRANQDAHLLVYEIDSDGYVRVLFPVRGENDWVPARHTFRLPDPDSDQELVVEKTTGQGYIVALASAAPFDHLPWYLRPYDPHGEEIGFVGQPDDEDGVTADGRIVGDPFVAMERIRRGMVQNASDVNTFGTSYASYYVHERVRYPRYICYDCHRPNRYAWWDGWDPYYSTCSVVDFRVNWSWYWGPSYWCGYVPYYVYVYRTTCPPSYRHGGSVWYSSWDGWNRWSQLWGGPLTRFKTAPPPTYVPPARWTNWRNNSGSPPPGFMVSGVSRGSRLGPTGLPVGRSGGAGEAVGDTRRPRAERDPVGEIRGGDGREVRGRDERSGREGYERRPVGRQAPEQSDEGVRVDRGRGDRPSPRYEPAQRPRDEDRAPRNEPPRVEKPRGEGAPRVEPPRREKAPEDHPAPPQRFERGKQEKSPPQDQGQKAPPSEGRNKRSRD